MCENAGCFVRVAGLWVWMIYRGVFCGFVDWFGSRGLVSRILPFRAAIWPDRGANGREASAYATLIAAISGTIPMMFMTRLRL